MTTATIAAIPIDPPAWKRSQILSVIVTYDDGREALFGEAHLSDAAGATDPTGWCTGSLASAEPDVLRAIREGRDEVEL